MNIIVTIVVAVLAASVASLVTALIVSRAEREKAERRIREVRQRYWNEREENAGLRCRGTRDDGERCRQTLGLDDDGLCRLHRGQK